MKFDECEKLYLDFIDALSGVTDSGFNPVKTLSEVLAQCRRYLMELRAQVKVENFADQDAEVHFFKQVKPKFYARKIFHFELYGLDMNRPVGTKDMMICFYREELAFIARFFAIHSAAYDYFRTGRTELDHLYFVRGAEASVEQIQEMQDADPLFSTSMDYLFSKFIAYQDLQEEIIKRIGLLDGSLVPANVAVPERGIKWTGKVVNLGELIYGLYYTGQLNHGNAQLSEIVALFERMFMVKIRDVHHTFGEIRERKVSSPSKFIDSMAAAILQRVDEDLKYKPGSRF